MHNIICHMICNQNTHDCSVNRVNRGHQEISHRVSTTRRTEYVREIIDVHCITKVVFVVNVGVYLIAVERLDEIQVP